MRVGAAVLLVELLVASPATAASLSDAKSAYDRNHVAEAEQMFAHVAADPARFGDDRSAAERELARIAWLIDGDADHALQHLAVAEKLGDKPCNTGFMTARVLREAKRDEEALRRGNGLIEACDEPDKRDAIRTHLIGARLDLAAAAPARRARLLGEAATESRKLTPEAGVEGARVRLETALLTDEPDAALAAWKDYFWLDDSDAPQALANQPVKAIFTKGLQAGATVDDRLKLADLLMRAGFAPQSRRYAAAHGLPGAAAADPIWRRLDAYWRERDKLEAVLLRVNRGLARGRRDDKALEAAAQGIHRRLDEGGRSERRSPGGAAEILRSRRHRRNHQRISQHRTWATSSRTIRIASPNTGTAPPSTSWRSTIWSATASRAGCGTDRRWLAAGPPPESSSMSVRAMWRRRRAPTG